MLNLCDIVAGCEGMSSRADRIAMVLKCFEYGIPFERLFASSLKVT